MPRPPGSRAVHAPSPDTGHLDVSPDLRGDLLALDWFAASGQQVVLLPSDVFVLWVHLLPQRRQGDACDAPALWVSGLQTEPSLLTLPARGWLLTALLTVPAALTAFGAQLGDTVDRHVVPGHAMARAASVALGDRIDAADSARAAAHSLRTWLERQLRDPKPFPLAGLRVLLAIEQWIAGDPARMRLAQVTPTLGVTRRQLERDFRSWCGVPPSQCHRLLRFQRTVHAVVAGEPLGRAADTYGYSDASHLNRTVRAMSLMTPQTLRRLGAAQQQACQPRRRGGRVLWVDLQDTGLNPLAIKTLRQAVLLPRGGALRP